MARLKNDVISSFALFGSFANDIKTVDFTVQYSMIGAQPCAEARQCHSAELTPSQFPRIMVSIGRISG